MAKTAAVGRLTIAAGKFEANVVPDPFDARDLEYRPTLQPLPARLDHRDMPGERLVLTQKGSSCTGHAVAAMVNTVLARRSSQPYTRVSPYMLYYLGRRYDEFPGSADDGSSLRGVLKGWWHHGVARSDEWKALTTRRDLDDSKLIESCRQRPLGAFYRVNPYRLDDMQSAICELHAIVASSAIHDGWGEPLRETHNGEAMRVIRRQKGQKDIGGHAFALVGYNEVGFLVQNSWGKSWGKGGFATLPYEEWLENGYDAWVARAGVPQTPLARQQRHELSATGSLVRIQGADMTRLRKHVLNLGNDGRLSTNGHVTSSPAQLDEVIESMRQHHAQWQTYDVAIFAHGGLVSEEAGLDIAMRQLNWWLNNRVYPIFVVWESGPMEIIRDQLSDAIKRLIPFRAGFDIREGVDRVIEKVAHRTLSWAWAEMKENARAASEPSRGVSILLNLLEAYYQTNPEMRLHLVGHSAGSILQSRLLRRARTLGLPVGSIAFLAAAITVADFEADVLPHIGDARFSSFAMSDQRELDDTCDVGALSAYHKSLLYLVSRGFERPKHHEVPILGMERFVQAIAAKIIGPKRALITAPSPTTAPPDSRSDAKGHGGFDEDVATMTSVMLRVRDKQSFADVVAFEAGMDLRPAAMAAPGSARFPSMKREKESVRSATKRRISKRAY